MRDFQLLYWLEEHNKLSESQADFRFGCSCANNLFVLNEVVHGRLQEDKNIFSFFLEMILYGEMVCGIECGRWEYKESHGM